MTSWSNPQPVGTSGGLTIIADLGDGLGHAALVAVQLVKDYATHHPPGYPFRDDPGEHGPGDVMWLLKPEADAMVAAGIAVYAGSIATEPPINVDAPYVSGSGIVGEPLTCTMGNWENKPNSYAYLWKKWQAGSVVALPGAYEATYVPTNQDDNKDVFCTVLATNEVGEAIADSNTVTCHKPAAAETRR